MYIYVHIYTYSNSVLFPGTVWVPLHILILLSLKQVVLFISHFTHGYKPDPEESNNLPIITKPVIKKQRFEPGNIVLHAFNHFFMLPIK